MICCGAVMRSYFEVMWVPTHTSSSTRVTSRYQSITLLSGVSARLAGIRNRPSPMPFERMPVTWSRSSGECTFMSSLRDPNHGSALVDGGSRRAALEIGRRGEAAVLRQERIDARGLVADHGEGMRHLGRDRDRAVGPDQPALLAQPKVERALDHDQHLVDILVEVQRCAAAGLDDAGAADRADALRLAGQRKAAIALAPRDLGGVLVGDEWHGDPPALNIWTF